MRSPPGDEFNMAYCIFFLHGIGQLFPWNVIINAEDYFRRRLCGSAFDKVFENSFALAYNVATIVGMALALRYQEGWNLRGRIMGSLAVSMLTFVACGILVLVEEASPTFLFFSTMGVIVASGLATAVLQGGLFSLASAFPSRYTQAMMAGQGLAGLVVALAGLFTALAGPDDTTCAEGPSTFYLTNPHVTRHLIEETDGALGSSCTPYSIDWSTLAYFGIAVAVILWCLSAYPVLQRLPITAYYTRSLDGGDSDDIISDSGIDGGGNTDGGGGGWLAGSGAAVVSASSPGSSMYRRLVETQPLQLLPLDKPLSDAAIHGKQQEEEEQTRDAVAINHDAYDDIDDGDAGIARSGASGLRSKLAPISSSAFAVFFVFAVTLSVFPGATSEIVSSRRCLPGRSRFFAADVFVLFSFVSFNAFDFLGRLAAGFAVVLPAKWLPAASISRLVFIPLFLACSSEQSRFRSWLAADIFPLALMPAFAFTNGYVGSLSMMAGSQKGAWAGTAMVLFLTGGLLAGSLTSFLVLYLSTGSI